ncbi:MAG TPA: hypothetical protein PLC86_22690, partial [Candidatus Accumulibacter phosphatis]|nr:hypothetical protein [Candidatus Accumulibacter phosphatis]
MRSARALRARHPAPADVEDGVEQARNSRALALALAASLLLHAAVLFFPEKEAALRPIASSRFDARLSPSPSSQPAAVKATPRRPPTTAAAPAKPPPRAAARPASRP